MQFTYLFVNSSLPLLTFVKNIFTIRLYLSILIMGCASDG